MKTLSLIARFIDATAPPPSPRPHRQRRAFSLVEVTLALGIVTFGLVSVVGVLPTALASGRQSFDQNRAAAIANTLFTSFRSQPFSKVCYVDEQLDPQTGLMFTGTTSTGNGPAPLDFNKPPVGANVNVCYAKFLSLATDAGDPADTFGAQRRLSFSANQPTGGADYRIALNFYDANTQVNPNIPASNQPEGMITTGQACRVEVVINAVNRPGDQYRFVSTVANRSN